MKLLSPIYIYIYIYIYTHQGLSVILTIYPTKVRLIEEID
jgi:hypothetical protein